METYDIISQRPEEKYPLLDVFNEGCSPDFKMWCVEGTPYANEEFKNNSIKINVQPTPFFSDENIGSREVLKIPDVRKKAKKKIIVRSASNNKKKLKKKLDCEFEYPFFSNEEELRCELFNSILDNVERFELFDSGIDRSNEYVYVGRFPFVPMTGDILHKDQNIFRSIELKFTKMYPQKDSKVIGKYYRVLRPLRIQPIQLELIENGLMTLVLIGELVEHPENFGIAMDYGESAKLRDACVEDIQILRDAYGRDELDYAYIIINQENFGDYRNYFESLALIEKREGGKIIGYRKTIRFPKLYRTLTPPERCFQAVRSVLCLEIVRRIFSKNNGLLKSKIV
ncbi:MAG: hypothetical protein HWN65_10120 [Candidatus Helarchaeota archaeon]|nr:hypothetical protein [Candidatus Helarchaeota archaeon]